MLITYRRLAGILPECERSNGTCIIQKELQITPTYIIINLKIVGNCVLLIHAKSNWMQ